MDNSLNRKQKTAKVLAWAGLIIITILICVLIYALVSANGKLGLAMIIALAFVSIILWIGIKLYKNMLESENIKNKNIERKRMNDIANMDTKHI